MKQQLQAYKNILGITLGCIVFYLWKDIQALLYIALSVIALSLASDFIRNKISFFWEKLGELLGKVFGSIVMGFIYFFILTPLALLRKAFSKDKKSSLNSFFLDVKQQADEQSFHRQW